MPQCKAYKKDARCVHDAKDGDDFCRYCKALQTKGRVLSMVPVVEPGSDSDTSTGSTVSAPKPKPKKAATPKAKKVAPSDEELTSAREKQLLEQLIFEMNKNGDAETSAMTGSEVSALARGVRVNKEVVRKALSLYYQRYKNEPAVLAALDPMYKAGGLVNEAGMPIIAWQHKKRYIVAQFKALSAAEQSSWYDRATKTITNELVAKLHALGFEA